MSVSSSTCSSPTPLTGVDPRIYCETMNELHSYLATCKRGYLTQAELFRYYRQRHDNVEIPYRLLGYRSLLDLLSSDQRLFSIDLHREPAYIYSAVKLRQQKREKRQGNASFSRQHHSTNTLDDQHDHHVPLNEQQQQEEENIGSSDEQQSSNERQNQRSITPIIEKNLDRNVWHTPQLDEQRSSLKNSEERNEETNECISNQFLSLPNVRFSSEINDPSSIYIKTDNQSKPIQRFIISHNDDYQLNKSSTIRDPMYVKYSSGRLNRSISTSTTSLSETKSFYLIDSYIYMFTIVACFIFVGIYLYKICFI